MSTAALVIAIVIAVYAGVGLVVMSLMRAAAKGDEQARWAELDHMIMKSIRAEDDREAGR